MQHLLFSASSACESLPCKANLFCSVTFMPVASKLCFSLLDTSLQHMHDQATHKVNREHDGNTCVSNDNAAIHCFLFNIVCALLYPYYIP